MKTAMLRMGHGGRFLKWLRKNFGGEWIVGLLIRCLTIVVSMPASQT